MNKKGKWIPQAAPCRVASRRVASLDDISCKVVFWLIGITSDTLIEELEIRNE